MEDYLKPHKVINKRKSHTKKSDANPRGEKKRTLQELGGKKSDGYLGNVVSRA